MDFFDWGGVGKKINVTDTESVKSCFVELELCTVIASDVGEQGGMVGRAMWRGYFQYSNKKQKSIFGGFAV